MAQEALPLYSSPTLHYVAQEVLSRQKRSWQIWSGLYNITIEILRALTIKLTQARARTSARDMARARAMARDRAMARTTDRPRLRARARVRAWKCVYV